MARMAPPGKRHWLMMVVVAVSAAGCDLGSDRNRSSPTILSVSASQGEQAIDGTMEGTDWVLNIPGAYLEDQDTVGALYPVIFAETNQLLDGATIQTAAPSEAIPEGDCTPADGWLTATPAVVGADKWYSCYLPSSSGGGSSVVLFKAADSIARGPAGNSWFDVAVLEVPEDGPASRYALSGSVKDQNGRTLALSVIANVLPPAGKPGDPVLSAPAVKADKYDVTVTWTATSSGSPTPAANYTVERADSIATPVTSDQWAGVFTTRDASVLTYTDEGLDPTISYWYRVVASSDGGGRSRPSGMVSLVGQPGGSTYSAASASSATSYGLTVNWTAPASSVTPITQYLLQRAPDGGGAPAPQETTFNGWTTVCTVGPGTTSCPDTGLDPAKAYWYQVVARGDLGSGVTPVGPANDATSAVPQPSWSGTPLAYDSATNTVTVSWKAPLTSGTLGVTGYRIERAPDNAGRPGTWAAIASVSATASTYGDSTVTSAMHYWYRVSALATVGPATVLGPPTSSKGIISR